jgi:preprotein translocase subunit SecF
MNAYTVVVIIISLAIVIASIRFFTKKEGYSSIIDFTVGSSDTLEDYNQKSFNSKHDEQEYLCKSRLCNSTPMLQERPHNPYNPKNFYTF